MGLTTLMLLTTIQAGGDPARIAIDPPTVELAVGTTVQLTATVLDASGGRLAGPTPRWFSSSPQVVSVDDDGTVTALSPGVGQVGAFLPGIPTFVTVTVRQTSAAELAVGPTRLELLEGTSAPLTVRAVTEFGDELALSALTFASSNRQVATVDPTGRVFARGAGTATIEARSGARTASVDVSIRGTADPNAITLTPANPTARTGDVIRFRASAQTSDGPRTLAPVWSVNGIGASIEADADEGVFVAERPGTYRITALIGESIARSAMVDVVQRYTPARLTTVGRGATAEHHAGDTWAFEGVNGRDYAYLGTFMHDWMKVWDVTDPGNPFITDSIQLDARRINDVKIHPNNRIGIVTREGASNRRNGIVILDLADPAHPRIISEYTATVTGGVHNVWITSNDLVYAVHNGTSEMHILDISDPANAREVGRWGLEKENKGLHDVIIQDGYAFLSYWDDGVVILDVGAATHGGAPTRPTFVSQYKYPIGNTHVAWRAGRYLFLGDEIFPPNWNADAPIEARGYLHIVDVSDIDNPHEVGRYEVPEAGVHNVWVEGDRLYVGYYQAGLRVVDISGELRGDLYQQGRELAVIKTTDANTTVPNWPMTWGAQIFKGHIFTSDLNSGLWILKLDEEVVVP